MKYLHYGLITLSLIALATMPNMVNGQGKGKGKGKAAQPPMSFFITSVGLGNGANLGGIAGADAHCQELATAAGSTGMTWHAFLSTQVIGGGGGGRGQGGQGVVGGNAENPGRGKGKGRPVAINARDRIGSGPWYNAKGQMIAANLGQLLGDTIEYGRQGNFLNKISGLDEKGNLHKGFGDQPNQHDILTGSQLNGTAYNDNMDHTCENWTSTSADGSAEVGHFDRLGGGTAGPSWIAAHPSRGCSQENLVATGGAGYFYCFAVVGDER